MDVADGTSQNTHAMRWLDEHGESDREAFILVQVAKANFFSDMGTSTFHNHPR